MEPLFTDDQLRSIAETEGLLWDSLNLTDQQFFRELKEREYRKTHETLEQETGKPFQPLSPVLRAPKGVDFDLLWFDFQTRFLLHPDLSDDERTRRSKAWKRRNRYPENKRALQEALELTQEEVRKIFFYTNGELYYKNPTSKKTKRGDIVSPPSHLNKARRVRVRYKEYSLAHLVYLYHHGVMPRRIVHLDGDKRNVSIENLVEV